ncbi:MAG TPA: class I SAM-dependent methyltransferase [Rubrivivax sp.]|nr:class I SAM-dependent methyltransferase [Rubrivivax sp.]
MNGPPHHDEPAAVAARYAQRVDDGRYDPLRPEVMLARQERERVLAGLLRRHLRRPLRELDVLEVGCGSGDNLLELLRLGADAARLAGSELLPARAAAARRRLPTATAVHAGDAMALPFAPASFDLVLQLTVFSSLLDDDFQQRLAERMWQWLRPGGAVLWYDFAFDNPRNRHVRAVPLARVRALFPSAGIDARRVTLAPPIGRRAAALHPALWRLFNLLPLLRTHRLAWIGKPHADRRA